MSKGNTFELDLLKLIFNGTAIADLAENDATAPLTSLFLSLHTADPGEAGSQTTSEATYTGYARQAVARTTAGFTAANPVALAAAVNFPAATAGTNTITHFAIGTLVSGTGKILYSGTVTPNIAVSAGVTPRLTTATQITED